jgi:hypothetical protein
MTTLPEDDFDPLYCPRCHQKVARAMANPDGWCYQCVAAADRERRESAAQRVEQTLPACPQCGGHDVVLTMASSPWRSIRQIAGWLILAALIPWWWWMRLTSADSDTPAAWRDEGEPHWRCKACDRVFPMR